MKKQGTAEEPTFAVKIREDLMDCVIVTVTGVVADEATQPFINQLDEVVADERVRHVALVLDETVSMSARAFGAIVAAYIVLAYRNLKLAVVAPRENFQRLMQMTGFSTVVKVYKDVESAVKAAW